MKTYLKTLAILLCFSCSNVQNSNEQTDSKADSKDSAGKTATLHSMKGFDLYVWKKGRDTFYTLLPGTNRNKTPAEIFDTNKATKGIEAAKKKIDQIAPGEYVFLKWVEIDSTGLSSLKEYMQSRHLVVTIGR
jgi:hypothetical protein